jgi:hypothetical protein
MFPADDDPDGPRVQDPGDLARDERAEGRVDAVLAVTEERLAGQLEEDPLVAQRASAMRRRGGLGHSSSPSA